MPQASTAAALRREPQQDARHPQSHVLVVHHINPRWRRRLTCKSGVCAVFKVSAHCCGSLCPHLGALHASIRLRGRASTRGVLGRATVRYRANWHAHARAPAYGSAHGRAQEAHGGDPPPPLPFAQVARRAQGWARKRGWTSVPARNPSLTSRWARAHA